MELNSDIWVFVALFMGLPLLLGLRRWALEHVPKWLRITIAVSLVGSFVGILAFGIVIQACDNGDLSRDSAVCELLERGR